MCRLKAEVTVFLSLLLMLLIAFIGVLIDSSAVNVSKSYARGESDRAIESVFAEYHQELMNEFGIFGVEATYETGNYYTGNLIERLQFYGSESVTWEITQLQLLTDQNGAAFEEQILAYMNQKYGITYLESLGININSLESQRTEGETVTNNLTESTDSIFDQVDEEGNIVELEDETITNITNLQKMGILELVLEDTSLLSNVAIDSSGLVSNRTRQSGINSYGLANSSASTSNILVSEYVLDQYDSYIDLLALGENSVSTGNLQYEVEYILEGKSSDRDNLEGVVNKILFMRMGVNYTCLMQSSTMRAEVSAMALSIATASGAVVLQPVIEQALILGWSYGESVMDMRSLLSGKRVALIKSELDWQLGLSGLMTLGTKEDAQFAGNDMSGGVNYEGYLKILLYLESKDNLLWRGLDMIEQRLQVEKGLTYFRVDYCVTQLECIATSSVMSDYTYEYPTMFGYQ